jgi:transposase InsO family protein
MKKCGQRSWTERAQQSFEKLKESLQEALLKIPEPNEELFLRTDASNTCIAAYLETAEGRPIAFASRKLSDAEQNYDIVEKEALAIFWSIVSKFRWLLLGRQFQIWTDHKPLVFLFSTTKVSPKVLRWRMQLQEFTFTIRHCAGKDNVVADHLSRAFCVDETSEEDDGASPFLTSAGVIAKQKRDPELRALAWAIKSKCEKRPAEVSAALWSVRRQVKLNDGILTYQEEGSSRWIIPQSLRQQVMQLAHDNHRGIDATLSRLRRQAYWPNSRKDVETFVKKCRICALVKPKFLPATLTPFTVKAPMEIVAMDFVGPLPMAAGGSRYMLVFIDLFSRFPEVYPCQDMSVATVIEKSRDFFSRYGFPDAILSDRGSQFESGEYRTYLSKFRIKKLSTTAYHPQGNGLCERFNKTIQQHLLALLVENQRPRSEWKYYLPTALLGYRTTPHRSTGFTPAELFLSFAVRTFATRCDADPQKFQKANNNV